MEERKNTTMLKDILIARGKKRIGSTDNREILYDLAVFPCIKLTERPITSTDLPTIEMIYRRHCFQKAPISKNTHSCRQGTRCRGPKNVTTRFKNNFLSETIRLSYTTQH